MSGRRRIISWERLIAAGLLVVGGAWALLGVLSVVLGMTQVGDGVNVPVSLAHQETHTEGYGNVPVTVEGLELAEGWLAGAAPGPTAAAGADGTLTLFATGSTAAEQALARGGMAVTGLAALVVAIALRPVLLGVAAGQPFVRGVGRRMTVVAVTIGVAGVLAPVLPQWAGLLALGRTGLASSGHFALTPSLPGDSLWGMLLLLVLAGAFRIGERNARELEAVV